MKDQGVPWDSARSPTQFSQTVGTTRVARRLKVACELDTIAPPSSVRPRVEVR